MDSRLFVSLCGVCEAKVSQLLERLTEYALQLLEQARRERARRNCTIDGIVRDFKPTKCHPHLAANAISRCFAVVFPFNKRNSL